MWHPIGESNHWWKAGALMGSLSLGPKPLGCPLLCFWDIWKCDLKSADTSVGMWKETAADPCTWHISALHNWPKIIQTLVTWKGKEAAAGGLHQSSCVAIIIVPKTVICWLICFTIADAVPHQTVTSTRCMHSFPRLMEPCIIDMHTCTCKGEVLSSNMHLFESNQLKVSSFL